MNHASPCWLYAARALPLTAFKKTCSLCLSPALLPCVVIPCVFQSEGIPVVRLPDRRVGTSTIILAFPSRLVCWSTPCCVDTILRIVPTHTWLAAVFFSLLFFPLWTQLSPYPSVFNLPWSVAGPQIRNAPWNLAHYFSTQTWSLFVAALNFLHLNIFAVVFGLCSLLQTLLRYLGGQIGKGAPKAGIACDM